MTEQPATGSARVPRNGDSSADGREGSADSLLVLNCTNLGYYPYCNLSPDMSMTSSKQKAFSLLGKEEEVSNSIQSSQGPSFGMISPVQAPSAQGSIATPQQAAPSMNGTTIATAALVAGALAPIGIAAYLALRNPNNANVLIEAGKVQPERTGTLTTTPNGQPPQSHGLKIEAQKPGTQLCGKHALNNALMALGQQPIDRTVYLEKFQEISKLPNKTLEEFVKQPVSDEQLAAIANALTQKTIFDFAPSDKIVEEISQNSSKNPDKAHSESRANARGMLIVSQEHWVAIAHSPKSGKWHILDSMKPAEKSEGFKDLEEAYQVYIRNKKDNVNYILINDKAPPSYEEATKKNGEGILSESLHSKI